MGTPIARIGDTVSCVCSCHSSPISVTGTLITGASKTYAENSNISRLGDIALCTCGHITTVVTSASKTYAENKLIARLGDVVSACPIGTIVTAASKTYAE
jgi:uncharacterized Zn-binding protein involved in type VI secretion